jgi:cytidine deaminase
MSRFEKPSRHKAAPTFIQTEPLFGVSDPLHMKGPTPAQLQKLKAAAKSAARRAYAPYSSFPVGAAILASSGKIYTGCNVENASYGLSNCAERTAVFTAVAAGEKKLNIQCIVIHAPGKNATAPCGACRQVLYEFGPDARVISVCAGRKQIDLSIGELLPNAFGRANLL